MPARYLALVARRSFRFGIWAGLLIGAGFALVKVVQARRSSTGGGDDGWPSVPPAGPAPAWPPPSPAVDDIPAPAVVAEAITPVSPPVDEVGEPVAEVGEPVIEVGEPLDKVGEPVGEPVAEVTPAPAAPPLPPVATPPPVPGSTSPLPSASEATSPIPGAVAPVKKAAKKATKKAAKKAAAGPAANAWIVPSGELCPPSHPVKATLARRIFRTPEMPGYDQDRPDRCYASEGDAVADGFTRARR